MPAFSMRPVQAPLLVKQCSIFARRVSTVGPLQHINLVQLFLASTAGRCHAVDPSTSMGRSSTGGSWRCTKWRSCSRPSRGVVAPTPLRFSTRMRPSANACS